MVGSDVIIILLVLAAVAAGIRIGLIRQIGLSIGMLVGCLVAALFQGIAGPAVLRSVGSETEHVVFWFMLAASVLFVGLFADFGWSLGQRLDKRFRTFRRREKLLNQCAGGLLASASMLVVAWLLASLFVRSPSPIIASQVNRSVLLTVLWEKMPAVPSLFARAGKLLNPHGSPVAFFSQEPLIGDQVPSTKQIATIKKAAEPIQMAAVQISGRGCGGTSTGSGFVVADNLVITNAHIVAGIQAPDILALDMNGYHQAWPVYFDPRLDIAILRTTNLAGAPMPVELSAVTQGSAGATLGFATGSLAINPVTILGKQSATGYDIYDDQLVAREVYAFRGSIERGDSGAALMSQSGKVIGLVFAKSSKRDQTGFALATSGLSSAIITALSASQEAETGQCGTKS